MEKTFSTARLNEAIEQYKAEHLGEKPLYCMMSTEEADALADLLRHERGQDGNAIITSYRDIRIIRDEFMEKGRYVLGDELPETGS